MFAGVIWWVLEGSRTSLWGGVASADGEADPWRWRTHSCSPVSAHVHGWAALLTGLISFLPRLALLSCLRLEPAAAESRICSARGLSLPLFPSSFICSFPVPPLCLIWHCKKEFLHLLNPPPSIKKKTPGGFLSPFVCLNLPQQLSSLLQTHEFQSRFPFVLRAQTWLQDVKRHWNTLYALKRKISRQKQWCVQQQWHWKPKALVKIPF